MTLFQKVHIHQAYAECKAWVSGKLQPCKTKHLEICIYLIEINLKNNCHKFTGQLLFTVEYYTEKEEE